MCWQFQTDYLGDKMNMNSSETLQPADAFVRGPSTCLVSSKGLGWSNLIIERHLIEPGEKPASAVRHHIVALASGSAVSSGERSDWSGCSRPYSKWPGMLYSFPEGALPALRTHTGTDLTVCAINPVFIRDAAEEFTDGTAISLQERLEFSDESTAGLIRLLETEARSGGPAGLLYVDHLLYALTLRLFENSDRNREQSPRNKLPLLRLRRVVERMEADLSKDLDLKILASESGYSRNHFLRMFRAATGVTPHQYLIRLRVTKAQDLIRNRSHRLLDVALACGFSSHAHLSRVFRQLIGATPSEYRRSVVAQ